MAKVVGALTRRTRRAAGRPQASAAALIRSKERLISAAKARAAGVAAMRRPVRTKRRWPSQVSRMSICRLTAPWVSPSSAPAVGIAAGASRDFEDPQGIERGESDACRPVRKIDNNREKVRLVDKNSPP